MAPTSRIVRLRRSRVSANPISERSCIARSRVFAPGGRRKDEEGIMDDKFLYEFREAPRPAFAESLRKKLRLQPETERAPDQPSHWRRWAPILSLPGILAVLAVMLAFPSARVAAQHF